MTLISFKDGEMAGDKRTFLGDLHTDNETKVLKKTINGKNVLIGGAGIWTSIQEVIEFLEGKVQNYPDRNGDAIVLVYDGENLLRYCGSHIPSKYPIDKPHAEGADTILGIALGAMYSGKSALDANLLAQSMSIDCGGGVDVVRLDKTDQINQ